LSEDNEVGSKLHASVSKQAGSYAVEEKLKTASGFDRPGIGAPFVLAQPVMISCPNAS
jgi:hypothetical protein